MGVLALPLGVQGGLKDTVQRCPAQLSSMMDMLPICAAHMWLLSAWNVASVTKELSFPFDLILSHLHSRGSSYTCLVAPTSSMAQPS